MKQCCINIENNKNYFVLSKGDKRVFYAKQMLKKKLIESSNKFTFTVAARGVP